MNDFLRHGNFVIHHEKGEIPNSISNGFLEDGRVMNGSKSTIGYLLDEKIIDQTRKTIGYYESLRISRVALFYFFFFY